MFIWYQWNITWTCGYWLFECSKTDSQKDHVFVSLFMRKSDPSSGNAHPFAHLNSLNPSFSSYSRAQQEKAAF